MQTASRIASISPSPTLAIDSKAKAMIAEGVDVINFSAGEPDFDTPEHIKAAAMGSLDAGFTKYTPASGIPELRTAIAEKLKKDNKLNYEPSQILVNCGAKHSCFNTILATIETDEEVIIPAPYWVSYPEMVKLAGGVPVVVPTSQANGYKMTPDEFRDAMTPRTRMVILNSPGNPTGAVYTQEELTALAEVALEEDILILSDEIYEKLIYDGAKHFSVASISEEIYNLTFTINGFSKPYAMTGWRLGYIAAPKWAAKALDTLQSQTTSNATSFAQKGAWAAYKGPQDCVETMRVEYDKRRQFMMEQASKMGKLSFARPQGAFYLLLNVSGTGLTSTQFAQRLLEEHQVAAVPGIAFGDDHTVRFSYATSMENIEKGMKRLLEFMIKF